MERSGRSLLEMDGILNKTRRKLLCVLLITYTFENDYTKKISNT